MPPEGPLATFGATWLGWDAARGKAVPQPPVDGIEAATQAPRKYGFHGTLKAPFRLHGSQAVDALQTAAADLATRLAPVALTALVLKPLGGFLALVPGDASDALADLASRCVTELDRFRAPLSQVDLDRRRASGLTPRQDELLQRWGYPYILEEFRFHMTLTGRLDPTRMARFQAEIAARLPDLPIPYIVDQIALAGERADGRFETLHRYALTGQSPAPAAPTAAAKT